MAGSKFYGLKNKAKKKATPKPDDLPKNVEVKPELAVEVPVIEQAELERLLDGLNEEPKEETVPEVEVIVNKAIDAVIASKDVPDVKFTAYGIYYNEEKKKFMKVSLDYNPISGYSKIRSEEAWADSAPTALNKLNRELSLKLLKREEKI